MRSIPAALAAGTIDGLRFLPHRVAWQALIYDHAALGRPPATWDELLAVARAHPGKIGFKGALLRRPHLRRVAVRLGRRR